jgi:hypothetical protein
MPSLTFTLLMDPPGEEQCPCRLANLQNTLPFSLFPLFFELDLKFGHEVIGWPCGR